MDRSDKLRDGGDVGFTDDDRLRAYGRAAAHEAGHALVAWLSPLIKSVISARWTGEVGKVTCKRHSGHPYFDWDNLASTLAGFAGEMYLFGRTRTAGQKRDLAKARDIARKLCATCDSPMKMRLWSCDDTAAAPDFSRIFTSGISTVENAIMASAYRRAYELISLHGHKFRILVEALGQRGEIDTKGLEAILGKKKEDKGLVLMLLAMSDADPNPDLQ